MSPENKDKSSVAPILSKWGKLESELHSEKQKTQEETREALLMELLNIKMEKWAKILQKTIIERNQRDPTINRGKISVERKNSNFVITSYGNETAINTEIIDKSLVKLTINWRNKQSVVSINGNDFRDEDLASIIAIANIINAIVYYTERMTTPYKKPFHVFQWKRISFWDKSYLIDDFQKHVLTNDWLHNILNELRYWLNEKDRNAQWMSEIHSGWLINNITEYLNRRYMDEVVYNPKIQSIRPNVIKGIKSTSN